MSSLWSFLYERLYQLDRPTISEREISSFPSDQVQALREANFLRKLPDREVFTDKVGRRYRVAQGNGQILGVLEDEDETDVIELEKEDLVHFRIDRHRLIAAIARQNDLTGSSELAESGNYFLGRRNVPSIGAVSVFLRFRRHQRELESAALLAQAKEAEPIVVIYPRDSGMDHDRGLLDRGVNISWLSGQLNIAWPPKLHAPKRADGLAPEFVFDKMKVGFETVGVKMDSLEAENLSLRQEVASKLTTLVGKVEPDYFNSILHIMAAGSVSGASKMLGIPNSTFSEKVKDASKTSPVHQALYKMIALRKKHAGTAKFEHFNEAFKEHQRVANSPSGKAEILLSVVEGLNAQNDGNWQSVRSELLEILEDHVP